MRFPVWGEDGSTSIACCDCVHHGGCLGLHLVAEITPFETHPKTTLILAKAMPSLLLCSTLHSTLRLFVPQLDR